MKYKSIKHFLYFALFFFVAIQPKIAVAQQDNYFHSALFNGRIYSFNPYNIGSGNPFLTDAVFTRGKVFVQGRVYHTLLNYDIQQQKVVIYYPFFTKVSMISIPSELVDSFYIQNRKFVQENFDGKTIFLEKIGKGRRYFLIKHQKVMNVDSRPNYLIYSQNIKSIFWFDGENRIKVKGKRSLIKLFDKQDQQKIKIFWRKNHFKFRKNSSDQWKSLTLFIKNNIS